MQHIHVICGTKQSHPVHFCSYDDPLHVFIFVLATDYDLHRFNDHMQILQQYLSKRSKRRFSVLNKVIWQTGSLGWYMFVLYYDIFVVPETDAGNCGNAVTL